MRNLIEIKTFKSFESKLIGRVQWYTVDIILTINKKTHRFIVKHREFDIFDSLQSSCKIEIEDVAIRLVMYIFKEKKISFKEIRSCKCYKHYDFKRYSCYLHSYLRDGMITFTTTKRPFTKNDFEVITLSWI